VTRELLENDEFCAQANLSTGIKGKKVIVQGFGNVGYNYAKFMHKEGAKIVGVIEKDVGIYNEAGFNPDEVKLYKQMHGSTHDLGAYPEA